MLQCGKTETLTQNVRLCKNQSVSGPKPIHEVVPSAVRAAVAAAMRMRSATSQSEAFFIFMSQSSSRFRARARDRCRAPRSTRR